MLFVFNHFQSLKMILMIEKLRSKFFLLLKLIFQAFFPPENIMWTYKTLFLTTKHIVIA